MTYSLDTYLPHKPPMRLIDSILAVNHKQATSAVTITENNLFYDTTIKGVYAWIGIELMAQTAAAFAFFQGEQQEPQMGFLISVRKFESERPYFKLNESLTIIAQNEYLDENIGVFSCKIMIDDKLIVSAKLNAFQPTKEQAQAVLKGEI